MSIMGHSGPLLKVFFCYVFPILKLNQLEQVPEDILVLYHLLLIFLKPKSFQIFKDKIVFKD